MIILRIFTNIFFLSPNNIFHGDVLSLNKLLDGDILSPNKIYQGDILSPNRGRLLYMYKNDPENTSSSLIIPCCLGI